MLEALMELLVLAAQAEAEEDLTLQLEDSMEILELITQAEEADLED